MHRDLSVTSRSLFAEAFLYVYRKKLRIYFIFQLMSDLCSRDTSIQSLISLRVHKLQWRTLSKHELSHLNRCAALVGIQHTP